MDGRKLLMVVVVLGFIGWMTYHKMQQRADDSKQIRADIMQLVTAMPEYTASDKLLNLMAERAHNDAFDAAYKVGGRRQANRFDEDTYIQRFFDSMIEQSRHYNRKNLIQPLIQLRDGLNEARKADAAAKP